jgi:hypothetical protein
MLVAVGDMACAGRRFRHRSAAGPKTAFCHRCWRLSAGVVAEGREMHKIWLGLAVLAAEAVVLVWLVGGHVLQWFTSGLAG